MAGTKLGGVKAAATIKQKWGEDFYKKIGAMGGVVDGAPKGFAANVVCQSTDCGYSDTHFIKQCAGFKGGTVSRKG